MKEMVCIKKNEWRISEGPNKGAVTDGPKFNEVVHVEQSTDHSDCYFVAEYPTNEFGGRRSMTKRWFADILPSESLTALLEETKTVEAS